MDRLFEKFRIKKEEKPVVKMGDRMGVKGGILGERALLFFADPGIIDTSLPVKLVDSNGEVVRIIEPNRCTNNPT